MATPIYEPFVGLTYDGVHSSELGLYRVSDGSRYNEDLLPSFSDKTVERTGADGMYFFGSDYQQKNWTIEFAFDHVTKEQLRQIRQWLGKGSKKPLKLVFDEDRDYKTVTITENINLIHNHDLNSEVEVTSEDEPEPFIQKYYMAKVAQVPQIKTLCFDEEDESGNIIDIYKGELTVEFISYSPFGYGPTKIFKYANDTPKDILVEGDIEVFPKVFFIFDNLINTEQLLTCSFSLDGTEVENSVYLSKAIDIQSLIVPKNTYGIVIDFEKGVINALTSQPKIDVIDLVFFSEDHVSMDKIQYTTDEKIYNSFINSGYFFSLTPGYSFQSKISSSTELKTFVVFQEKMY